MPSRPLIVLTGFRPQLGVSAQNTHITLSEAPLLFTSLLTTKAAVTAAIGAVAIGGLATATAAALPTHAHHAAHQAQSASPASGRTHHTNHAGDGTPVGPKLANGHTAYGLCTAYAHASKQGKAAQHSVAFRNLVKAANGAANVTAFCAGVTHPGTSSSHSPHRAGQSSSHPRGKSGSHTSGRTASHHSTRSQR
ncbi:MAG TPA: hypothetical protein VGS19_31140 [Streptosporangiaceae bacterium]|nr:hypothetical protein [Streptosporangiaceae bacterium]